MINVILILFIDNIINKVVDKKLDLQPLKLHPFYLPYKKYILQIDENKKKYFKKEEIF